MSLIKPKNESDRFLEQLAAELNNRAPLQARVERTVEGAVVRVANPDAGWMTERVSCRRNPMAGGDHWFWWEWGASIAPANDLPGAVATIARSLTPESWCA